MMAVALGRSRATGRFGGNRLPSLIVWFLSECSYFVRSTRWKNADICVAEDRTLGVQNLQGLVLGSGA